MARIVIVGCGCRGQSLARALRGAGHAVRGTTRREDRRPAIEAAGVESYVGDPDRVGTLTYALDQATILCWLLGSATGAPDDLAALHGRRLQAFLERTIDTTVRGVVYEAAGTLDPSLLDGGIEAVRRAGKTSAIPYALLDVDPADHAGWLAAARGAIDGLLTA